MGAYLVNVSAEKDIHVYYWSHKDREVDFLLEKGDRLVAIEVKSGHKMKPMPGLELCARKFNNVKMLLVGQTGIPVEEFLQIDPNDLF